MKKALKKKALITGATGLVGSACMETFAEKGYEVIGIDINARAKNLGTPEKKLDQVLEIDFTRLDQVFDLFKEHKFDVVVHAGGQASHDWSNDHVLEDFMTNAFGTVVLLEATRHFAPKAVFIYVSTDKVYGDNLQGEKLSNEDLGLDHAGHRSPFGCSKASADMYVQEYAHTFGLKTGIFRPGCITGKNHEGAELHGMLAYLAKCIRTGTPYKIFGYNGKQVRDQIHANDLVAAFLAFADKPRPGEVYNIGGGPDRARSLLDFAELISKETGKEYSVSLHPERPGDRAYDVHDVAKFRSHFPDWDYRYDLAAIIKDICSKEI